MHIKKFLAGYLFIAAITIVSCGSRTTSESKVSEPVIEPEVTLDLKDYGKQPTVIDIEAYTLGNDNFRTALWTGTHFQVTLMTIPVGGEIGLEQHSGTDQFLRIEQGSARVMMGDTKDNLTFVHDAKADYAVVIPAGKWHNLVNTGSESLKLYSIYAPVEHPFGTVHKTLTEAIEAENDHF